MDTPQVRKETSPLVRGVWPIVAICAGIAVAFIVALLLSIRTSVNIAKTYAEGSSEFFASELNANLEAMIERQSVGIRSHTYDQQLIEFIEEEAELGSGATARAAAATLDKLVADSEESSAFVVSGETGTCYVSNGYILDTASRPSLQGWVQQVRTMSNTAASPAYGTSANYTDYFIHREPGTLPTVYVGRPLYTDAGKLVGITGVCVYGASLQAMVDRAASANTQSVYMVSADGAVLYAGDKSVASGSSIATVYPQFNELLVRDGTTASGGCPTLWEGLGIVMPHDQCLYELHWLTAFGCYMLTVNRAESLFSAVKSQLGINVAAIAVLLVLVVALVLVMVRWYRQNLLTVARTDELTGLANRKSFGDSFEQYVERGRLGEATLALVDIDLFKRVNDTYGHAVGDIALQAVAHEVLACVGEDGLAGRWGGDEFIAVLRVDDAEAQYRLHALISRVAALQMDGCPQLTVSVGATHIQPHLPLNRIVEQADDALYVTKDQGRNGLNVYKEGVTPHMNEA